MPLKKPETKKKTAAKKKTTTKDEPSKNRVKRYPSGVVVTAATCDLRPLIVAYNGTLPDIKSKTKKYPSPTDTEGWKVLYADALTYRNKGRYCSQNGFAPPACPKALKSKYEYLLYHGRPDQVLARSKRNADRKKHGLKKGDKRQLHHTNPDDIHNSDVIKLTHCEHQAVHGKTCKKEKTKKKK